MNFSFVLTVPAGLAFLSFGLTFWRWVAAARFPLHRRAAVRAALPGCTVLKPLKDCDAQTKACLRSWLAQEYSGPVQFLFGVAGADDPVCPLVRELLAEFPGADAQLVLCAAALGVNGKISTLRQLEPLIRQPLVIISDADVRVPGDFLANLTPPLADPEIGLVNCFYRLANPGALAMRWEAIAVNADFWTSVLQAQSLMKVDFALGAVMALRAAELRRNRRLCRLGGLSGRRLPLGPADGRAGPAHCFLPGSGGMPRSLPATGPKPGRIKSAGRAPSASAGRWRFFSVFLTTPPCGRFSGWRRRGHPCLP